MTSGQMWNHIRGPPFMHKNPQNGQVVSIKLHLHLPNCERSLFSLIPPLSYLSSLSIVEYIYILCLDVLPSTSYYFCSFSFPAPMHSFKDNFLSLSGYIFNVHARDSYIILINSTYAELAVGKIHKSML